MTDLYVYVPGLTYYSSRHIDEPDIHGYSLGGGVEHREKLSQDIEVFGAADSVLVFSLEDSQNVILLFNQFRLGGDGEVLESLFLGAELSLELESFLDYNRQHNRLRVVLEEKGSVHHDFVGRIFFRSNL